MTARELIIPAAALVAAGAVYGAAAAQSGWAIFTDHAAAEAFAAQDAFARGYPKAGAPATTKPAGAIRTRTLTAAEHRTLENRVQNARRGAAGYGWTTRHADVRRHPDGTKWAYPLDGCTVPLPSGTTRVPALSSDWTPPAGLDGGVP